MSYSVYVVEDHPIMRATLKTLLERDPEFAVSGMAASAEEALAAPPGTAPSLFLVDMSLPDMNGADLVRRLAEVWPGVPCLVLSGHGESGYVEMALEAGARGYVLKGEPKEIPRAIRAVIGGERFLSPRLNAQEDSG